MMAGDLARMRKTRDERIERAEAQMVGEECLFTEIKTRVLQMIARTAKEARQSKGNDFKEA